MPPTTASGPGVSCAASGPSPVHQQTDSNHRGGRGRLENSDLLINLVVALIAASVGALIAARLGQSVILGYIAAGIMIGPNTPGFVGDTATVDALANIGIILLMFAIGIQFSLRDLLAAGRVATLGSTVQVVAILGIGMVFGMALGWSWLESLFFGAVISNSSSTVLSKVLGERGEMDTPQGRLAIAWSTVQDLGTVILIVVLTSLAGDTENLARNLTIEVGLAVLFLLMLIPVGLKVLPAIFTRIAMLRSREVFILSVTAVALGLAYGATFFGLSLALGAFAAGVVVNEPDLSHQIVGEIIPIRDIFSGVFFVSIGMLVDPSFVIRNLPLLAATIILIMLVKGGLIAAIAAWLGTPTRIAVLTGAVLAQSAEFSFLLARLGQDLNAVSPTVFNLMLAGAAASIVLMPAVYRGSMPAAATLAARYPNVSDYDPLATDPDDPPLSGHAIICGYGRVGQVVGQAIGRRFTFIAIDEDPRVISALRAAGYRGVQGNAGVPAVLERTNPSRARVLVVAIPDPIGARQIVDYAREHYPRLDIVVRTHSAAEREYFLRKGVNEVVLGEWELALEITRHALHRFGVGSLEVQHTLQRLRSRVDVDIPEERR